MKIKINFVLTASVLVLVILLISNYKTAAQHQSASFIKQAQDRVIIKKSDWNPPVKITKVKTKKGVIELDKPYDDDDDWLKGLTVSVDNHSGKDVTYINVEVLLRRPADTDQKPPGVWHLEYGEDPFRYTTGEPIPPISVKPIKDGESFDITLSDHDFYRLIVFLHDIEYSVLKGIEVRVTTIGFVDGTAWIGRMVRRDPGGPFGWSDIEPLSGRGALKSLPWFGNSSRGQELFTSTINQNSGKIPYVRIRVPRKQSSCLNGGSRCIVRPHQRFFCSSRALAR